MKNVQYILMTITGIGLSQPSFSQSDNYWSWNFNTLSILKAGAIVGGGTDASAIYFNPSLISQEEGTSLTLSANLLSIQFFNAENLAGDEIDLNEAAVKIQPRFISYNFPSKNERLSIEASVLAPASEEMNYSLQHFNELDIIQRTLGLESYSGYLMYSRKYEDIYVGLGSSYQISDHLSAGASLFVSNKLMSYEYRSNASAFQERDTVIIPGGKEARYIAQNSIEESLDYWDVSLVFKLGMHYHLLDNRLGFGINLTLPNIPMFGWADVRKSVIRGMVYDNSQDQFTSNNSVVKLETDAKTRIKSPFSAAFGVQYQTPSKKNAISFTLEYFHQIELYELLESDSQGGKLADLWSGPIEPTKLMTYSHQALPVINFSIGFNQYISPAIYLLGGFRTDYTNGDTDQIRATEDAFKVNQIHLNKYHITLGPVMRFKRFQLITGVQYSFASNRDMLQVINYSDPIEYIPATNRSLEGNRKNNMNAGLNEISLFLGLTVHSK